MKLDRPVRDKIHRQRPSKHDIASRLFQRGEKAALRFTPRAFTPHIPVNASHRITRRTGALVLVLVLGTGLCLPAARAQQQLPPGADTSGTRQVEIVAPSDSLVQSTTDGGARRRTLIGNVRLRQETTRLRSDRATQYLGGGEILFTGDVLIIDEGDSLWADRVRYDSRQKVGRATGDVRVSSDGEVLLAGPVGRYYFDEEHAVFPEHVTLVDSTRVLKSRGGEYFSTAERAEFYRQVRVFGDSTYLEADSVTYRRNSEVSEARGDVFIERRGDRASSAGAEESPNAPPGGGARRAVPDTGTVVARADTARPDTSARMRRPSLLGRPLPVDTTRRALLPDTTARTLLWGEYAYNDPRTGYSRVTERALLVRLQPPDSSETTGADSARTSPSPKPTPDTLIVRAHQLETARSDTLRRLTATDSVRLWQNDLQVVADSAVYDRWPAGEGSAPARPDSLALADTAFADTTFADPAVAGGEEPSRRESRFFGNPLAWNPGSGQGSAGAQLSGDSLRVTGRGGAVRRLYTRGNAFLAQEDSVLEGRLQQLKGRRMRGYFAQDSTGETTLRRLWTGPNAEAIYFQKKDAASKKDAAPSDSPNGGPPNGGSPRGGSNGRALAGAVRVSSDSIVFRMRAGELERMRVLGGVEGARYKAKNVPDPFRLDGLVWSPARRPRKDPFLTEERVRRRLTRPDAPPKREAPPSPADATPPPTAARSSDGSSDG
ncbi:MAG: hypothetical protein BRD37_07505 [Bacteroidetes bacterium QH_8_67_23]|nr:MAG: hypothetical protein BRD37_07505 [Bacteroidetes bacterium QH_8_67_23]